MPDDFGDLAVNTRVHTHYPMRTRGCGCAWHPAFPAPSFRKGRKIVGKPRAKQAARSRNYIPTSLRGANGSRECAPDDRLSDEAIQLSLCRQDGLLRGAC